MRFNWKRYVHRFDEPIRNVRKVVLRILDGKDSDAHFVLAGAIACDDNEPATTTESPEVELCRLSPKV